MQKTVGLTSRVSKIVCYAQQFPHHAHLPTPVEIECDVDENRGYEYDQDRDELLKEDYQRHN